MDRMLLTTKDLCGVLGLSKRTIERMAELGEGPPRLKLTQKRIAYRKADVENWINSRKPAWQN
jgi:predicted DNA-binding transcriptional regulator AlpA